MKNLRKLPTVSIAVSALNEEPNIGKFLNSVVMQEVKGFKLEKILVISDGSTDKTVEKARLIKHPRIQVIGYKKRIGKSRRLNEIFARINSDYLVLADADVIFADKNVTKNLIKPFEKGNRIGMTGGHPMPLPAETFVEQAVNVTLNVYIPFRKALKGGHNVFSATGRIMALRKSLYKHITVDKNTISNDIFIYLSTLTKGFEYRYAKNAFAYFRSPQTLKDHLNQNTRFAATPIWMSEFFTPELVKKEFEVPKDMLYKSMLKQFLRYPIHCLFIFTVNRICEYRAHRLKKKITALWNIVYSTKKLSPVGA